MFIYLVMRYSCFTVLVSAVRKSESALYVYIYPFPLELPSHPDPHLGHPRAPEPSSLCYTTGFPLAIYFKIGGICIYQSDLPIVPPPPSFPTSCLHVHFLHLHLYFCPSSGFLVMSLYFNSTPYWPSHIRFPAICAIKACQSCIIKYEAYYCSWESNILYILSTSQNFLIH